MVWKPQKDFKLKKWKFCLSKMELTKVKIADLKEATYNPRKISKEELAKLKSSIQEFGYVNPIIINRSTGKVIGGHQRIKALKELGIEEIEVVYVDLPEEKERALNIALNKISGEWDEQKLIEVFKEIEQSQEEMLKFTGFDQKEIEILLNSVKNEFEAGKEDNITLDMIKTTKIQPGDLFEIAGKHRILCGDSTNPGNLKLLFGVNKADLLVTSPPYNADIKYAEYKDNKELKDYLETMKKVYQAAKDQLNPARYACVNLGDMTKINLSAHHSILLESLGYRYSRTVYWLKPEGAAQGVNRLPYPRWYKPKVNTETVVVYLNSPLDQEPEMVNVMLVYADSEIGPKDKPTTRELSPIERDLMKKYSTNVWKLAPETHLSGHPAPFPIELPEKCIIFYSLEGEIVFDPFMEGGTTILAAEKQKRRGFGIELSPAYVELTIQRYRKLYPLAEIRCLNRELSCT